MKKYFATAFARSQIRRADRFIAHPIETQQKLLSRFLSAAVDTAFGREHGFGDIRAYQQYRQRVPLCTYEDLRGYIQRIAEGERDVLWPGRPAYFAKTSGTTSGTKYIPLTRKAWPARCGLRGTCCCVTSFPAVRWTSSAGR